MPLKPHFVHRSDDPAVQELQTCVRRLTPIDSPTVMHAQGPHGVVSTAAPPGQYSQPERYAYRGQVIGAAKISIAAGTRTVIHKSRDTDDAAELTISASGTVYWTYTYGAGWSARQFGTPPSESPSFRLFRKIEVTFDSGRITSLVNVGQLGDMEVFDRGC